VREALALVNGDLDRATNVLLNGGSDPAPQLTASMIADMPALDRLQLSQPSEQCTQGSGMRAANGTGDAKQAPQSRRTSDPNACSHRLMGDKFQVKKRLETEMERDRRQLAANSDRARMVRANLSRIS